MAHSAMSASLRSPPSQPARGWRSRNRPPMQSVEIRIDAKPTESCIQCSQMYAPAHHQNTKCKSRMNGKACMTTLDLSDRPAQPWITTPGGAHGTLTPPRHWFYVQVAHDMQLRWPGECACCLGSANDSINLSLNESSMHPRVCKVPLCAACARHQQMPILRERNHVPNNLFIAIMVGILLLFLLSVGGSAGGASIVLFGLFILSVVAWWLVHFISGLWEGVKLRKGNHCLTIFSVVDDVEAENIVKVLERCTIWQAVVAVGIPGRVVLGFGNKKYATEFLHLNGATQYSGDLPSVAWF